MEKRGAKVTKIKVTTTTTKYFLMFLLFSFTCFKLLCASVRTSNTTNIMLIHTHSQRQANTLKHTYPHIILLQFYMSKPKNKQVKKIKNKTKAHHRSTPTYFDTLVTLYLTHCDSNKTPKTKRKNVMDYSFYFSLNLLIQEPKNTTTQ